LAASSASRDAAGSKDGGGGQTRGEELAGWTQRFVGPRVQPLCGGSLLLAVASRVVR
jgi:hypothetical protein